MSNSGPLRRRIVLICALLALTVCAFFSGSVYYLVEQIEGQYIERRLVTLADWLVARHQQGLATDLPPGTQFFVGDDIPQDIRVLPVGFHEITKGGDALNVVVQYRDGFRFAVTDNGNEFAGIEDRTMRGLAIGFVGSALLAIFLGFVTANRVVAPVTALAKAVKNDTLQDDKALLEANDEIGVLAREFAARTEELRGMLERERQFTGDVSHELRTPLTVILGAAELLASKLGDAPDHASAAERIRRTAVDSAERVTALLLLARSPQLLGAPRIELRPLVAREIERCRPLLVGGAVELRLEATDDVHVCARGELAGIAIGNLLRNACQYTERGSIVVRLLKNSVVIEDTGPGLPALERSRLVDNSTELAEDTSKGWGLGLVKRVIDHLGWELQVEHRSAGGSRFVVLFPAS